MDADAVAAKYQVSRAWVHRLQQRRRETGSIAPRKQTRFRPPLLAAVEPQLAALIAAQPDRTLGELREALGTSVSLTTIWRAVARLGFTLKKNGVRVRTNARRRRRRP